MTFERKLANLFNLNDANWMKHANPISVWTRYTVLPIIILSVWSRDWIGWWSLIPIFLSVFWTYFNPVFFHRPISTRNWASKAVLGERIYLNRDQVPIPEHHDTGLLHLLNGIAGIGFFLSIWAAITYSFWGAIIGIAIAYLGKSWFLDRMVWLFEDMKHEDPRYLSWEY